MLSVERYRRQRYWARHLVALVGEGKEKEEEDDEEMEKREKDQKRIERKKECAIKKHDTKIRLQ